MFLRQLVFETAAAEGIEHVEETIKWGEPSETALQRELKEETDLEVEDLRFVMVQDCIHSKEFYRDAHFLLRRSSVTRGVTLRSLGSIDATAFGRSRHPATGD